MFRENFSAYYSMLNAAGLWPFDESVLGKVQRVVFALLMFSGLCIQVIDSPFAMNLFVKVQYPLYDRKFINIKDYTLYINETCQCTLKYLFFKNIF